MTTRKKPTPKAKPVAKADDLLTDVPSSFSPFDHLGSPGVAIYSGYVVSDEKDTRLVGQERYTTYGNMLANAAIVATGVRFFINLVAKATWRAEPADDSSEAEEKAELVEDMMGDMATPWHRVIRRAAMFRFYGFSLQEWIAKRREDGVIGYQDVEPRAQKTIERWDTDDESGAVLGVFQRNPKTSTEQYIPRAKCVYIVDDSLEDSPEGLGLFRHLAKLADRLARYELLEGWGFETDLRGIPVGRGPFTEVEKMVKAGTLSREQATAMKQPLLDFIQSHNKNPETGMLLDSMTYQTSDEKSAPSGVRQWDLELLQGTPTSAAEVAAAIQRINREMARAMGVEHLLLGEDSQGSFALSKDKTQNFGLLVDSTLKELKETFQRDWLDPIWELNGWDPATMPELKIEQVQYRDVDDLTAALERLAKAGAPLDPEDPAINEIRALLGLSDAVPMELSDPDLTLAGGAGEEPPTPRDERAGEDDDVQDPEDEGVGES